MIAQRGSMCVVESAEGSTKTDPTSDKVKSKAGKNTPYLVLMKIYCRNSDRVFALSAAIG